jgi:TonB family C-terminal domain
VLPRGNEPTGGLAAYKFRVAVRIGGPLQHHLENDTANLLSGARSSAKDETVQDRGTGFTMQSLLLWRSPPVRIKSALRILTVLLPTCLIGRPNAATATSPLDDSTETRAKIAQAAVEHLWASVSSVQERVSIHPIIQRDSFGRTRVKEAKEMAKTLSNRLSKPFGPTVKENILPLRVSIPTIREDSTAEITIAHHGASMDERRIYILHLLLKKNGQKWNVKYTIDEGQYHIDSPAVPWSEISFPIEQKPKLIGGRSALQDSLKYQIPASRRSLEGRVFVKFVVGEKGNVLRPSVSRGGHKLLNEAAVEAFEKQKFRPGMLRGEPVRVTMSMPVSFEPPDSSSR